jgi:hypothetical protein
MMIESDARGTLAENPEGLEQFMEETTQMVNKNRDQIEMLRQFYRCLTRDRVPISSVVAMADGLPAP